MSQSADTNAFPGTVGTEVFAVILLVRGLRGSCSRLPRLLLFSVHGQFPTMQYAHPAAYSAFHILPLFPVEIKGGVIFLDILPNIAKLYYLHSK